MRRKEVHDFGWAWKKLTEGFTITIGDGYEMKMVKGKIFSRRTDRISNVEFKTWHKGCCQMNSDLESKHWKTVEP